MMDVVYDIIERVRRDTCSAPVVHVSHSCNRVYARIPACSMPIDPYNTLLYDTSYDVDSSTYTISLHIADYDMTYAMILMLSCML